MMIIIVVVIATDGVGELFVEDVTKALPAVQGGGVWGKVLGGQVLARVSALGIGFKFGVAIIFGDGQIDTKMNRRWKELMGRHEETTHLRSEASTINIFDVNIWLKEGGVDERIGV